MFPTRSLVFAGVGIGPSNLSLAALSAPLQTIPYRFFEKNPTFQWHPDFLFEESLMQTSFLKDLVIPVAPSSQYSFLSFLVAKGRFYQFLNAAFSHISRHEFCQYLKWVADVVPHLEFHTPVHSIDLHQDHLELRTDHEVVHTRHVVLGTGRTPHIPECAKPHLGDSVMHSALFGRYKPQHVGRRVAVIGGGQSSAELINHLLLDSKQLPQSLIWLSRRSNFLPLDDTPFVNEWFTPEYSEHFFKLPGTQKQRLLAEQKLASDGVSADLLKQIYQRLYALRYVEGCDPQMVSLLPNHELGSIRKSDSGWRIEITSGDGRTSEREVDLILLATGYEYRLPPYLEPLAGRIPLEDGGYVVRQDFSIQWDGPEHCRIYVQNGARAQRGIADPNLSLIAWRSAIILNSVLGRPVYDHVPIRSMVDW